MNDLTELLVFTSAKKALKDPEFLSGELWIDTRARRRLRKETSMIKNVIPWRKKESKDEVHLATVLDKNKSIETFLELRENYLKTEVVKEEGESYIINEMNQKGRRIYEVTYDYYVGEAEPTQGTLTVTFEKDGAGNYIVGNCEF